MKGLTKAVIGLLFLGLLGAACAPAAAPAGPPAPAAGPPSPPKPIVLGVAIAQTGKYERTGVFSLQGYQLAVKMINERGGINGRPLRLVVYDDQSDPSTGVKLVQKLIAEDRVDLLVGPYSSAVTRAVVPVVEQAGIPMVAPLAADTRIWVGQNNRWSVQMAAPAGLYLVGALEVAAKAGAKTLALVYENTSFPTAMAEGTRQKAKELGLTIVLDEAYEKGITDWTPVVAKAKDRGADLIFGGGYFPDAVGLTKAVSAVGYKPLLQSYAVGVVDPDFPEAVGPLAECVTGNALWLPIVKSKGFIATNQEFVKRFQEEYGRVPVYQAALAFGGIELIAEAIKASLDRAGKIDPNLIREYLFTTKSETVFGTYEVVPSGPDAGLQKGAAPFIVQWQKDPKTGELKQEIIWPEEVATAEPCFGP